MTILNKMAKMMALESKAVFRGMRLLKSQVGHRGLRGGSPSWQFTQYLGIDQFIHQFYRSVKRVPLEF